MLKRGYYGVFHGMSPEHLQRYVDEFSGQHNQRSLDTAVQMRIMAKGMVGKRLRYQDCRGWEGCRAARERPLPYRVVRSR